MFNGTGSGLLKLCAVNVRRNSIARFEVGVQFSVIQHLTLLPFPLDHFSIHTSFSISWLLPTLGAHRAFQASTSIATVLQQC